MLTTETRVNQLVSFVKTNNKLKRLDISGNMIAQN